MLTPARERRVIWNVERETHQVEQRTQEALDLAQWQLEQEPQSQRRLDG